MQRKLFHFDKMHIVLCKTLNWNISSKVGGNFGGILGNPGEIPHIGCKILGSKGFLFVNFSSALIVTQGFLIYRSIADHRRSSQTSPQKPQLCGQLTTHDGMFPYSPAMEIAAMANIII